MPDLIRDYHLYSRVMTVDTWFRRKIREGKAFEASRRFTSIADGDKVDVLFENPSGSGVEVTFFVVEVNGGAELWPDVLRNVSKDAAGSPMDVMNPNMGSDRQPKCRVESNGTYSGGTKVHETVSFGGQKQFAVGSLAEIGGSAIIPQGNNVLARIWNMSGSPVNLSVRVIWVEE